MTEDLDNFTEVSQVHPGEQNNLFHCDVPDGWQQGRGAFGGYGIALAIRALEAAEAQSTKSADANDRPIRALTAELPGPLLPGPANIEAKLLRRGKGMTSWDAAVTQNEDTKVRLSALFGVPRATDMTWQPNTPTMQKFGDTPPIPQGMLPPRFARHFEYRVCGTLPFSSSAEATCEGWISPRVQLERWGPAEIAALADAYWPSFFATLDGFRPMATVTFSLTLTEVAERLDPSQPLYYRARSLNASAGYVVEMRELWTAKGELVAFNPQTFVIIS